MADPLPSWQSTLEPPPRLIAPHKEPPKAYEAFVAYYNLGEARTIAKLSEQYGKTPDNYRKFRQRWWWDERIAAHVDDARAIYRARLRERATEIADKVLTTRLEILDAQLKAALAIQKKADLITALPVTEETRISKDGKTTIILKPINCRATDGGKLALMADALLRSLTHQSNPEPKRRGAFGDDGTPLGKLPPPEVEVYIDNGDGTRGRISDLPPPDKYVAGDDDEDDDEESGPEAPAGTAPL